MANKSIDVPKTTSSSNHEPESLTLFQKLSYGVGHFLNDTHACMAWTYMILFYQKVIQLKPWMAGFIILVGQTSDAFGTVFVGWKADKGPMFNCLEKVGKWKSWHLVGTIGVAVLFPLTFSQCYFSSDQFFQLCYYSIITICLCFFWSCTQVSHLAMIPDLCSSDSKQRVTLNSLRCASMLMSSVVTYGVVMVFLSKQMVGSSEISPDDLWRFTTAVWILVAISLFVVSFFYCGTKELSHVGSNHWKPADSSYLDGPNNVVASIKPLDWLKEPQFYLIALIYAFTRHYINISQLYFPFYIQYTQGFHKMYVAVFPLITFLVGFLTLTLISSPAITRHFNRKLSYFFGSILALAACCWLWFSNLDNQLYFVSILMGVSQSILLVTSLTFISDLVGDHTENSGFVYGLMSFSDKITIGLMSQIVQTFNPSSDFAPVFYRDVMVFLPSGCVVIALIGLLVLLPQTVGSLQANRRNDYKQMD